MNWKTKFFATSAFSTCGTKEMMQPCPTHLARHLFGCGTKEMMQPCPTHLARHLVGCGTKEMMQPCPTHLARHLFGCARTSLCVRWFSQLVSLRASA